MKMLEKMDEVMIHGVCEGIAAAVVHLAAEGVLPVPESMKGLDVEAATLYLGATLFKASMRGVARLEDFAERNPAAKYD